MKNETKEQRFKRIAERRVQNILDALGSLSQCSNRRVYAWNDEQLHKIWAAIEDELAACKESYTDPGARTFRL